MIKTERTTKIKLISVQEYFERRQRLIYTTFIMKPDGSTWYVVNGEEVSSVEFEKANALPASLVVNNSANPDGQKKWLSV